MKASAAGQTGRFKIDARIEKRGDGMFWVTSEIFEEYCSTHQRNKHGKTGTRDDVWFAHAGSNWHGVRYGTSNVCHCEEIAWP